MREADYLRFLDMAYGSCRELGYQLSLASRLGFIAQHIDQPLADLNEQTAKVLNGLLRALRSKLPIVVGRQSPAASLRPLFGTTPPPPARAPTPADDRLPTNSISGHTDPV